MFAGDQHGDWHGVDAVWLLCLVMAIPLITDCVGRNPVYGVRFREAFRSNDAWFAINRFGGKRMALWSIPQIIWGIAAYFVPMDGSSLRTILLGITPVLFVLIPAFESWRFARRCDAAHNLTWHSTD